MPSEGPERPGWRWLASQGLGLVLGQATVVLLAVGSIVIAATRDGASAGVRLDELHGFFSPPSPVHGWLYLLLPVLALYALNTFLCTWESVAARWRRGTRELAAWAPSVIHVAFLFALLSHLVGGLGNHEEAGLTLTDEPVRLDDGRTARLAKLEVEQSPSGKLAAVHATLQLTDGAGRSEEVTVGYNQPLSFGLGSSLLLLAQAGQLEVASFALGEARCHATVPGQCQLGETGVGVRAVRQAAHWGTRPVAVVSVWSPGSEVASFPLAEGAGHELPGGGVLRFEGVESVDAVELRRRVAPGHPWALVAGVLLVAGLAMMGRRWLRQTPETVG